MLATKHSKRVLADQLAQLSKFTAGELSTLLGYLTTIKLGFKMPRPDFLKDHRVLEAALLRLQADVLQKHLLAAINLRAELMGRRSSAVRVTEALDAAADVVKAAIKDTRFSKYCAGVKRPASKLATIPEEVTVEALFPHKARRAELSVFYPGASVFQKDIPPYHPPLAERSPARLLGKSEAAFSADREISSVSVESPTVATVVFHGYKAPTAERSVARLLGK